MQYAKTNGNYNLKPQRMRFYVFINHAFGTYFRATLGFKTMFSTCFCLIFNVQHNQHIYLPAIETQYNFTELSVKKLIQGAGYEFKCVHAC